MLLVCVLVSFSNGIAGVSILEKCAERIPIHLVGDGRKRVAYKHLFVLKIIDAQVTV